MDPMLFSALVGAIFGGIPIFLIEFRGVRRRATAKAVDLPTPLESKIQLISALSGELASLYREAQDEFILQLAETERLSAEG